MVYGFSGVKANGALNGDRLPIYKLAHLISPMTIELP